MPYFSVVIPSYNRCSRLRAAVESVLAQTFADYELIVVDDGSTDDTPLLACEFGSKIKYIRQLHAGVSAARNAGMRAGDSAYVAFLDSDDIWLPTKLAEQRKYIEETNASRITQCDELWVRNGRRVNKAARHEKRAGFIFADSLRLCMISPSAVIMRRDMFEEYGMFDESLPACEDYDLWLRITCREAVGLLNKNLVVRYAGHGDQLSAAYWGMDRFRAYAILKLLNANKLSSEQEEQALESVADRLRLLAKGAVKRNKMQFVADLNAMLTLLAERNYSSINYPSLLKE